MLTWIDVPDDLVELVNDFARELDMTREDTIRIALWVARRKLRMLIEEADRMRRNG